jgi:hypothetical protein
MLITYLGLGDCAEHRAAGDAEMLRQIFTQMLQREPVVRTMEELALYAKLRTFEMEAGPVTRYRRRIVW